MVCENKRKVKLLMQESCLRFIEIMMTLRLKKTGYESPFSLSYALSIISCILFLNIIHKKNATTATARDILEGDSVSLGLSYDRITDISAMSKTTNKSGIIKEVVISCSARITV